MALVQGDRLLAREQSIADVNRVLSVQQQQALLDYHSVDFELSDRQLIFHSEVCEIIPAERIFRTARFLTPDLDTPPIGQTDIFGEVIQHHYPTKRCRYPRNQKAVLPPVDTARNRD